MASWNLLNPNPPWQARDSQGFTVYDNRIWILGGWFTPETPNPRDVWSSPDGIHWEPLPLDNPWKGRHAQAAYVHHDQIIVAAGHARPVTNEVWALQLP